MLNALTFVQLARTTHGNKYGYDKVVYINRRECVDIECFEHGIFKQSPSAHVRGNGCPECAKKRFRRLRKTTEMFIAEINQLDSYSGKGYDSSKIDYVNNSTKVTVGCPIHGDFDIRPSNILLGQGCPKCAEKARGNRKLISLEKVIARANNIHGFRYDYSAINEKIYGGMHESVTIKCTEHNKLFRMTLNRHVNCKDMCPVCKKERLKNRKSFF